MNQIKDEKNLVAIFTEEADTILYDIMTKYSLKESDDERINKLMRNKLSNEVILDHEIKNFLKKELSFDQFIKILEANLEIDYQSAENLAKDIKEVLLQFIDLVPEDQLEEYNEKHDKGKLKNPTLNNESNVNYIKKIDIKNVEENAEISQQNKLYTDDVKKVIQEVSQENLPEKEKLGENRFEDEKKGPDSYREPIE